MILDNQNANPKVHTFIEKKIKEGTLDIVTGYFTIGALAFLSEKTNEKLDQYRFVIGDIVQDSSNKIKALDLLNETITTDTGLQLQAWAKKAAEFLQQEKVECKTLEPNFCHAKLYINNHKEITGEEVYIMGSSNLTEAGIGLKPLQNVELNSAGSGMESIYKELKEWFETLWNKKQASIQKTLIDENGKTYKMSFKQYLIDEISKIFKLYEPLDIYEKILFTLFNEEEDIEFQKDLSKLETSEVYKKLFTFQQTGVRSILHILKKNNGAILADAVGLGKTWSALAVIKYFQIKGRQAIILCPKKLDHNWCQYKYMQNSLFENDELKYEINWHTDFTENNLETGVINFNFLNDDRPKLIVIDESHNLRNDKSIKYKILMEHILQKSKGDIKVLLLSATPFNNNFKDIRNQFALLTRGDNNGFEETLQVKNLEYVFREMQKYFNVWQKQDGESLHSFYSSINQNDFFKLTENLVVARTRKQITKHFDADLHFPKACKPINIYKTPLQFGDYEDFGDLMENLKLNLSAYQPSQFTITKQDLADAEKQKKLKENVLTNNVQREQFLVKMMKILLLKRLESSWKAFQITATNIFNHHENALKKIKTYQTAKKENAENILQIQFDFDEEFDNEYENITLGKKTPIALKQIDEAGRLDDFKNAILADKRNLLEILNNVTNFEKEFYKKPSVDIKLVELLKIIANKQTQENKKIIIFTAYKDTAQYLYTQLSNTYKQIAMVHGGGAYFAENEPSEIKNILEQFAPYTKLFLEKKWAEFALEKNKNNYNTWQDWIKSARPDIYKKLINPINILITTDVLSEGQNLQDADLLVNYDIHWNPVRVIQRFGRIDRIGSPNNSIQCINFWPSTSIDGYINLRIRVEKRMAAMQFIGSEVMHDMTDRFREIAVNPMEEQQTNNLLKQMEGSLEELDGDKSIGFDDFSFDIFKQQLMEVLKQKANYLQDMPNGIFSGFTVNATENLQPGIIALLGNLPKKENTYTDFNLVHIDMQGNVIADNIKVVLEALSLHKNKIRNVNNAIDAGDKNAIAQLQNSINNWVQNQNTTIVVNEHGITEEVAGAAQLDALALLQKGNKKTIATILNQDIIFDKKYDLITWLIVSN